MMKERKGADGDRDTKSDHKSSPDEHVDRLGGGLDGCCTTHDGSTDENCSAPPKPISDIPKGSLISTFAFGRQ